MKTITAVFSSQCSECLERIEADVDEITKIGNAWVHESCAQDILDAKEKLEARNPFAGADDPVIERYRSRR